jgi:hypothetical protein
MFLKAHSRLSLLLMSFGATLLIFLVGLFAALCFDFPVALLSVGFSAVNLVESWGLRASYRLALPITFVVWWFVVAVLMSGARSWRAKRRAA